MEGKIDKKMIPLYLIVGNNMASILLAIYLLFAGEARYDVVVLGIFFLILTSYYILKGEYLPWLLLLLWNLMLVVDIQTASFVYDLGFGFDVNITLGWGSVSISLDLVPLAILLLLVIENEFRKQRENDKMDAEL